MAAKSSQQASSATLNEDPPTHQGELSIRIRHRLYGFKVPFETPISTHLTVDVTSYQKFEKYFEAIVGAFDASADIALVKGDLSQGTSSSQHRQSDVPEHDLENDSSVQNALHFWDFLGTGEREPDSGVQNFSDFFDFFETLRTKGQTKVVEEEPGKELGEEITKKGGKLRGDHDAKDGSENCDGGQGRKNNDSLKVENMKNPTSEDTGATTKANNTAAPELRNWTFHEVVGMSLLSALMLVTGLMIGMIIR